MSVAAGAASSDLPASARPENHASSTTAPSSKPKSRSCVVCRNRKVRCDKESPCSNCRRANIACVFASTDRPPRWARRLNRHTEHGAANNPPVMDNVMARMRTLEKLVKELSSELAQAHAATVSASGGGRGSSLLKTTSQAQESEHQVESLPDAEENNVKFGRLVLEDVSAGSRYVSSSFWSRVNDELDGLDMDSGRAAGEEYDSSEDEPSPEGTLSSLDAERTASERHAFLFRHNLSPSGPELNEFRPQPSQIPFLLDVYLENVNIFLHVVHVPTITQMVRDLRGAGIANQTPSNEALLLSIYYAAIASMEEEDVIASFSSSKTKLCLKYRLGLEYALAKADFLNSPDLVLVQALTIYLTLARRHDSPKYVWMMTGLLIRMAQYLGLQRDGTNFEHMTPFETHTRRGIWWVLCYLDVRASEDQGTALGIPSASYDTKIPSNINDVDIHANSKEMPAERHGMTDMSVLRMTVGVIGVHRQLMAPDMRTGIKDLEHKIRLVEEVQQHFEEHYFNFMNDRSNALCWVAATIARVIMSKLTLVSFLPMLFSSPNKQFTDEVRTKLLFAAIELSEHHHALNTEPAARQWRWMYQTRTHWHTIVYLTMEVTRRPWSPTVERAWVALHRKWLIPAQVLTDKNSGTWIPIRKMIKKARKHRDAELKRLRADPQGAAQLEKDDQKILFPIRSGPYALRSSVEIFRKRWWQLVSMPQVAENSAQVLRVPGANLSQPATQTGYSTHANMQYDPTQIPSNENYPPQSHAPHLDSHGQLSGQAGGHDTSNYQAHVFTVNATNGFQPQQFSGSTYNPVHGALTDWPESQLPIENDPSAWMTTDIDLSSIFPALDSNSPDIGMELDDDMNWYNWIETAKTMESSNFSAAAHGP